MTSEETDPMASTHPTPASSARRDQLSNPCKARTRAGNLCGQPAIPGAAVCHFHGGEAPQVKRKAALRLLELVDPAVATLARIMADPNAKNSDRLRAAENVLDRAGVPRRVDVSDTDVAKQVLMERLLALRAETTQTTAVESAAEIVAGQILPTTPEPNEEPTQ